MSALGLPAFCTRLGPDGRHVDDLWLAMAWAHAQHLTLTSLPDGEVTAIREHVRAVVDGSATALAENEAGDLVVLALWDDARPCACHPDGYQAEEMRS